MSSVNVPTTISVIGFFTFMMFWTLNSESGRDMNDIIVDYWAAKVVQTSQVEEECLSSTNISSL